MFLGGCSWNVLAIVEQMFLGSLGYFLCLLEICVTSSFQPFQGTSRTLLSIFPGKLWENHSKT